MAKRSAYFSVRDIAEKLDPPARPRDVTLAFCDPPDGYSHLREKCPRVNGRRIIPSRYVKAVIEMVRTRGYATPENGDG